MAQLQQNGTLLEQIANIEHIDCISASKGECTNRTLRQLAERLSEARNLKHVSFKFNEESDGSGGPSKRMLLQLAEALSAPSCVFQLKYLKCEGLWRHLQDHKGGIVEAFAAVVTRHLDTLLYVDFSLNLCRMRPICKALRDGVNLVQLNLRQNSLDAESMRQISDILLLEDCSLVTLNLTETSVGDRGCHRLACALPRNSSLKKLSLRACGITDAGVDFLCDAFRDTEDGYTGLTHLDLSHNHVAERGMAHLWRMMTKVAGFKPRNGFREGEPILVNLRNNKAIDQYQYGSFPELYSEPVKRESCFVRSCVDVRHRISGGSFGDIFSAVDFRTGDQFCIKVEKGSSSQPQLDFEYRVYGSINADLESEARSIHRLNGLETDPMNPVAPQVELPKGFPRIRWCWIGGTLTMMGMELLGHTLETLFNACGRKFSNKTIAMLGIQIMDRLELLHSRNLIHRDVKPDNFLFGLHRKSNTLHMVDLGLARKYRDPNTGMHIPFKEGRSLTGTPRYASIPAHKGHEQSRRDDFEAVAHMLLYFARGRLPWQGVKISEKNERNKRIGSIKMSTPVQSLCQGCAPQLLQFLIYCRNLKFQEDPNYAHCKMLFYDMLRDLNEKCDLVFDWSPTPTVIEMPEPVAPPAPRMLTRSARARRAALRGEAELGDVGATKLDTQVLQDTTNFVEPRQLRSRQQKHMVGTIDMSLPPQSLRVPVQVVLSSLTPDLCACACVCLV
ncbi:MAG: hypothetical protein MHM6MM_000954 [Cercozoa sp. M6MM]